MQKKLLYSTAFEQSSYLKKDTNPTYRQIHTLKRKKKLSQLSPKSLFSFEEGDVNENRLNPLQ